MTYVLIIDDDARLRESIKDLITISLPGVRVAEAVNGRQGLEMVEVERPDYILMDFQMPVMDGHDTALALQKHPERKKITLVGMSGSEIGTARLVLTRTLCDVWLPKPVTFAQLQDLFNGK
jgi:CheY-like chemotaxis protein